MTEQSTPEITEAQLDSLTMASIDALTELVRNQVVGINTNHVDDKRRQTALRWLTEEGFAHEVDGLFPERKRYLLSAKGLDLYEAHQKAQQKELWERADNEVALRALWLPASQQIACFWGSSFKIGESQRMSINGNWSWPSVIALNNDCRATGLVALQIKSGQWLIEREMR